MNKTLTRFAVLGVCLAAGSGLAHAQVVRIIPVIRQTATAPGSEQFPGTTPPASDGRVDVGSTFYVELWASNTMAPLNGLACVHVDVSYLTILMDATLPLQGTTLFPVQAVAPVVNDAAGLVDDAGGCQGIPATAGLGVGEWVLVRRIEASATGVGGPINITLGDSNNPFTGTSIIGQLQDVDPADIEFLSNSFTIGDCLVDADCDDGNPCTDDSCNSNLCANTNNTDSCDDGNACTSGDVCAAGSCNGSAITCDDSNLCTDDTCDPGSGCVFTDNTAPCDDGDACTTADTCAGGACVGGSPPNCDDGNVCTDDSCASGSGCVNTNNTASCDDGNACTTADTCSAGACVGGAPPNCDDGNPCTDDSCNAGSGCVNTNNTAPCDDGNACTTADTCSAGACVGGAPPNCDDGNICTDDSCDSGSGCLNTNNTAGCDDGDACTSVDTCAAGVCVGGRPRSCDDGIGCTIDSCNSVSGCVNTPTDSLCNNNLFCDGVETCDALNDCQAGTPPSTDDGVGCTDDSCDETNDVIVHTPNNANCDDGLFCNGAETCDAVNDCQAGTAPVIDDGVGCTDDSCDEINDVIVHAPNNGNCDDTLFCNGVETCDAVNDCQSGSPPSTDDGVACTDDSCDETNDVIINAPNNSNCDNGMFCDGAETCDAVAGCQAGTAPTVDDGVGCTDDSCDEVNDVIINAPNDSNCDNGMFCDGAETCDAVGDCQAGTPPGIDDGVGCTDDSCDEVNDIIVHAPNDALCDNSMFCDGVETCDAINDCQAGVPPAIDDGVGCTDDSCDEVSDVILNTPNNANCDNGMFCDGAEACDPVNDCQAGTPPVVDDGVSCTDDSCDEVNDVVVNVANDANCDDTLFCNGAETCDAINDCQAGTAPVIDDGVGCTDDSCDEINDVVVNVANDANCDDTLFCNGVETCDAVNDCQPGTAPVIDDGVGCTDDSCDEINDVVVNTANDTLCNDLQFCNGVETCDAINDCQAGTAPVIDDGVGCTDDSCDEISDVVVNTANDANCDDTLFCNGVETCDAVNDCQAGTSPVVDDGVGCTDDSCDEVNDVVVNTANDANCDDGMFCTGTETCDAVLDCQPGTDPCVGLPDPNLVCNETTDSCDGTCAYDCNFNTVVDTGDYSFFLGCFATVINPGSPCECADFNNNGVGDTGDYSGLLGCFGQLCPCPSGGPAPGIEDEVEMQVTVRRRTKVSDYAATLPRSIAAVEVDEAYFVDVWARVGVSGLDNLACAAADLTWDGDLATVEAFETSNQYAMLDVSVADDNRDRIYDLGGCVTPDALAAPAGMNWVRIATVEMVGHAAGVVRIDLDATAGSFAGVALVGADVQVDEDQVTFGGIKLLIEAVDVGIKRTRRQ